jgi:hypothetical protein
MENYDYRKELNNDLLYEYCTCLQVTLWIIQSRNKIITLSIKALLRDRTNTKILFLNSLLHETFSAILYMINK